MIRLRGKPEEDNSRYPDFITSDERDKVINALLKGTVNSESVILEYEDIPNLKISPHQFRTVIQGLKDDDRNNMDKFFKSINTKLETVTKTHEVFELFKKAAAVFIGD